MSKGAYIGIEGVARKVKDIYIGVDGVARKVKRGYVGVDGVARLFFDKVISNGSISLHATLPYNALHMAFAVFEQYGYFYFFGGQIKYATGTSDTGVGNLEGGNGQPPGLMWPPLPKANYGMAYATVGTKVYLFGGKNDSSIIVFDDDTLSMSKSSGLWSACYTTAVSVGTKVYLFGGAINATCVKNVWVYDTGNKTINEIPDTPCQYGYYIAAAAVGTKVYLFGGLNRGTLDGYDTIYVFDTVDETIKMLSTKLPTALISMAAATVGTKVYLFGGRSKKANGDKVVHDTIYVFDTEDETITTLSTKLPTAAHGIAAATVGTKVYLFGGETYNGVALDTVYIFDTEC